ncbi:hypothetical protein Tco_0608005 [Tanacetum coccineum]
MISHSNTGKKCACSVTQIDLWYLYNFSSEDKHCNVAYCLASYLTEDAGKTRSSPICGGHFVFNHVQMPLEPPDDQTGPSTTQQLESSLSDVD